jgi:hypothetical protein
MDGAAATDGRGVGRWTATGAAAATTGSPGMGMGMGMAGQSMPNRLSWTTGFDARRGGEPQNSGGCGDAADRPLSSPCQEHVPTGKRQRHVEGSSAKKHL